MNKGIAYAIYQLFTSVPQCKLKYNKSNDCHRNPQSSIIVGMDNNNTIETNMILTDDKEVVIGT